MNTVEGLGRLARACHWTGIAGAAFFAVEFAREWTDRYPDDETMLTAAVSAVACYAVGRAAAWIVRGFAAPR